MEESLTKVSGDQSDRRDFGHNSPHITGTCNYSLILLSYSTWGFWKVINSAISETSGFFSK